MLDLLADLNERDGRTIVLVLHDLNLACRYADHLIAMKDGRIVTDGAPAEVVTNALVADVFGLHAEIVPDPITGTPLVIPVPARIRRRTGTAPVPGLVAAANGVGSSVSGAG